VYGTDDIAVVAKIVLNSFTCEEFIGQWLFFFVHVQKHSILSILIVQWVFIFIQHIHFC
jgi:hypothetical protein